MGSRSADLADHLWAENLQEVQDTLAAALGIPLLFVDPSGRPLAVCEDLNEFCRWFTRAIPLVRPCLECGRALALNSHRPTLGSLASAVRPSQCPLGVWDAAVPIWSAGEVIGYLATAQVRVQEAPGEGWPAEHSPDPGACAPSSGPPAGVGASAGTEEHLAVVNRLPVRPRLLVEEAASALSVVSYLIGALANARRRNLKLAERLREQTRWIQANERTDAVTGIANRRRFCEVLEAELARVRRYQRNLSLAVLDVRDFHHINDEFGHEAGDGVLRAVAQALVSTVRQTDFVARLGGDEFGVLFTETTREGAMIALARIALQVEDLNASGELPVELALDAGVAEYLPGVPDLIEAALQDLERAKQSGRLSR